MDQRPPIRGGDAAGRAALLVAILSLAALAAHSADRADPVDPAEPAATPSPRTTQFGLVRSIGAERIETSFELHDLPAAAGERRLVIVPAEGLPGLPLATIIIERGGRARPEISDPSERIVVDALLDWLEAEAAILPEWKVVGSEGSERIKLPSLRLHSAIAVRRSCSASAAGEPPLLRVTLESPVTQEGAFRIELRALEWTIECDAAGEVRRAELRRDLVRSVGGIEAREDAAIVLETRSSAPLAPEEAAALGAEADLLVRAARALLPGQSAASIDAAKGLLADHRREYPEGRLSAVVPRIDAGLASRGEELAGGSPDERAAKLVGQIAPDFSLQDIDGAVVDLASLRGKPVVLSFWGYT